MASELAPDTLGPTVCVGEILIEIVATTIGEGFRAAQPLIGPFPSGAPAIFISQCGKLGGKAAMVGAVGDDDFGKVNLERLKNDGVDISAISVDSDYPTGSAFVRYRQDGSRDFVFNIAQSAAARFGWTQEVSALIEQAGHLHVMGSALSFPAARDVIDHAINVIKARGGTLSLDPNIRKELKLDEDTEQRFQQLLASTDLLLPSGEELERAAGVEGEDVAIAQLFARGNTEIFLKRGADGASYFSSNGSRINMPAFKVEEIDPTGAGDCFGGTYLTCRRLGMTAETSLRYAAAAGARNVTFVGPMEGAGTLLELDAFIALYRGGF